MTKQPGPPGLPAGDETGLAYLRRRVARHVYWARTQGIGRLVEEDQLNPLDRIPVAVGKAAYRRRHGAAPGTAVPVFLVGVQRSGTNMLVRGLERAPEFEVHNENDQRAFERFRLRGPETVNRIVHDSRHRFVLFKPLCESHDVDRILAELPAGRPGKAIWAFRNVDGRVRSALAKFGDANLTVLGEIAAGRGAGRWQAGRLSAEQLEFLRSFDYRQLTPESASALFWCLRNELYFDLGLDRRDDVFLSSYDALVAAPEATMRGLCGFLGFPYTPKLVEHIEARPAATSRPLDIDPRIRQRCDALTDRLATAAAAGTARAAG